MNDLKTLFRLLREEGVKSLHIEFQSTPALSATLETVEKLGEPLAPVKQEIPAKHDIPVHRGEPTGPEAVLEKVPVMVPTPDEPVIEKKAEPVPEKKPEPVIEKAVEKAKTVKETKPVEKTKPVEPAAGATVADKNVYDAFVASTEKDGGSGPDRDLIGRMGLDDLLRLNNDFCLGLDTDVPENDLRKAAVESFS